MSKKDQTDTPAAIEILEDCQVAGRRMKEGEIVDADYFESYRVKAMLKNRLARPSSKTPGAGQKAVANPTPAAIKKAAAKAAKEAAEKEAAGK